MLTWSIQGLFYAHCQFNLTFSLCCLQLEESKAEQFEKVVQEDNLYIERIQRICPENFVKKWRLRVWNVEFLSLYRRTEAFSKTKVFKGHKFIDLDAKQVLFPYVTNSLQNDSFPSFGLLILQLLTILIPLSKYSLKELHPKGAIEKKKSPMFLTTWINKIAPLCMLIHAQIPAWFAQHLQAGCCYLDCKMGFCPKEEEDFKKTVDVVKGIVVGIAAIGIDQVQRQDAQQEEDLSHLNEKEREVEKVRRKKKMEEEKAVEKAKKTNNSSGKASTLEVEILDCSSFGCDLEA
jgi:hypothetical protein